MIYLTNRGANVEKRIAWACNANPSSRIINVVKFQPTHAQNGDHYERSKNLAL